MADNCTSARCMKHCQINVAGLCQRNPMIHETLNESLKRNVVNKIASNGSDPCDPVFQHENACNQKASK